MNWTKKKKRCKDKAGWKSASLVSGPTHSVWDDCLSKREMTENKMLQAVTSRYYCLVNSSLSCGRNLNNVCVLKSTLKQSESVKWLDFAMRGDVMEITAPKILCIWDKKDSIFFFLHWMPGLSFSEWKMQNGNHYLSLSVSSDSCFNVCKYTCWQVEAVLIILPGRICQRLSWPYLKLWGCSWCFSFHMLEIFELLCFARKNW